MFTLKRRRKKEKKKEQIWRAVTLPLKGVLIESIGMTGTRKSPVDYQRSNCHKLDPPVNAEISGQMVKLKMEYMICIYFWRENYKL